MAERDVEQKNDVKTAIFEAAETVFAVYGFYGATTRAIAEEADVNLAMIHYHFGSKEQLHEQILFTRAQQLTSARTERLDAIMADKSALTIDGVLDALLRPLLDFSRSNPSAARNYARMVNQIAYASDERSVHLMSALFDVMAQKFIAAIQKSLPGLGRKSAIWAYQYAVMSGLGILVRAERVNRLAGNGHAEGDLTEAYRLTFTLVTAGVKAIADLKAKRAKPVPAKAAPAKAVPAKSKTRQSRERRP